MIDTMWIGVVKYDAAHDAYVAAPPITLSATSRGVLIVSMATVPIVSKLIVYD